MSAKVSAVAFVCLVVGATLAFHTATQAQSAHPAWNAVSKELRDCVGVAARRAAALF